MVSSHPSKRGATEKFIVPGIASGISIDAVRVSTKEMRSSACADLCRRQSRTRRDLPFDARPSKQCDVRTRQEMEFLAGSLRMPRPEVLQTGRTGRAIYTAGHSEPFLECRWSEGMRI
jgi:hypothetical protein